MLRDDTNRTAEPGLTALLRQLGTESTALIRNEIALAKLEAGEIARVAALEGAKVGASIALAAVGGLAIVAWLILALGNVMGDHYASAALIIGCIFLVVGGLFAKRGISALRAGGLQPEETIETLVEDKRWAAQQLKEFKSEIASHPGDPS
jgi:hypothetical protein